jgi:hypothetical protein
MLPGTHEINNLGKPLARDFMKRPNTKGCATHHDEKNSRICFVGLSDRAAAGGLHCQQSYDYVQSIFGSGDESGDKHDVHRRHFTYDVNGQHQYGKPGKRDSLSPW